MHVSGLCYEILSYGAVCACFGLCLVVISCAMFCYAALCYSVCCSGSVLFCTVLCYSVLLCMDGRMHFKNRLKFENASIAFLHAMRACVCVCVAL